jgi:hypothetical protein
MDKKVLFPCAGTNLTGKQISKLAAQVLHLILSFPSEQQIIFANIL